MAQHGDGGPSDLPATWPFRLAGTIFIIAMVWFCLGFAIHDLGNTLDGHMGVFKWLMIVAAVLVVGGTIFNIDRERRRKRHG
ncbi:MAG: hypothetical protein AB7V42_03245 [Thermoleophilia bacterium]